MDMIDKMVKKYIDLSLIFSQDLPIFPGGPSIKIDQVLSVEKQGVSVHTYFFDGHTGTHIDAPAHFVKDGKTLAELPPEKFTGQGIVIDARDKEIIGKDILNNINLAKEMIVFFRTDHANKLTQPNYFEKHPTISTTLAEQLVKLKVKIVGIDSPSVDKESYPVHKLLLANGILILENLCNLELLTGKTFTVYSFPLKVHTDGIPVRVIAELKD